MFCVQRYATERKLIEYVQYLYVVTVHLLTWRPTGTAPSNSTVVLVGRTALRAYGTPTSTYYYE